MKVFPRLKIVRMLTKMWMGLYLSLLQVVLYITVVVNHDTTYWQQHHTVIPHQTQFTHTRECYYSYRLHFYSTLRNVELSAVQ